jgi:2-polyprenyl-6-hydroxyphenyl methylase / 3-demethylubiquinone-9 3-methyltransferase
MKVEPNKSKDDFYGDLHAGWYCKTDRPISWLLAENRVRWPWICQNLSPSRKILDIGCGAGMLANTLAKNGHRVTGVDISEESLELARSHDETLSVRYLNANAYSLPFADAEFDVVCLMNLLELVEEPYLVVGEAARVLKPKGSLFFQRMNRTIVSFLIGKGIEDPIFSIRPEELEDMFETHKLMMQSQLGVRPKLDRSFWKMLIFRQVPNEFSFCLSRSLKMGYFGLARKRGSFSLH